MKTAKEHSVAGTMENLRRFRRKILPNGRLRPFTKVQLETVIGVGPSDSAGCSPPIPYGQSVGRVDGGMKRGLDGESGLDGENDLNGESECNGKHRRVDDLLGSKVPERRQTDDAQSASLQSDNGDIRDRRTDEHDTIAGDERCEQPDEHDIIASDQRCEEERCDGELGEEERDCDRMQEG